MLCLQIWIIETFPHLQVVCNVGFRVEGRSGPIWYSKEPQVPLMHNKVEDALLTVAQVCGLIYKVVMIIDDKCHFWCECDDKCHLGLCVVVCRFLFLGMML